MNKHKGFSGFLLAKWYIVLPVIVAASLLCHHIWPDKSFGTWFWCGIFRWFWWRVLDGLEVLWQAVRKLTYHDQES